MLSSVVLLTLATQLGATTKTDAEKGESKEPKTEEVAKPIETPFDDVNRIKEFQLREKAEEQKQIDKERQVQQEIAERKAKAEQEAKEKAEQEAKEKAEAEQRAREEEQRKAEQEAQAAKEEANKTTPTASTQSDTMDGTPTGKTFIMESTAYSSDPRDTLGGGHITATGQNLLENPMAVAVDPNVIPLGTKLYVEGYGTAYAVDTGSAIKGNIVDVHFSTYEQCVNWGRRQVKVTILE